MADLVQYKVLRAHDGDKHYAAGDTRKANPNDVAHLIGKTLAPAPSTKMEPAPLNKAAVKPKFRK